LIACVALACMLVPAHAGVDPSQGTWVNSLRPRDLNGDKIPDAYYDLDLNMTWMANANAAGPMLWEDAMAWADSLSVQGLIGGWRLPVLVQVPHCNPTPPPQECFPTIVPGTSELEHMFRVTLGNTPSATPDLASWNSGPFTGLQPGFYFTNQEALFAGSFAPAWMFNMGTGAHDVDGDHLPRFAWALRAGDVFPVPELPTLQLAVAGLALFGALPRLRRRRASTPARP
jgi:hypothetical protein